MGRYSVEKSFRHDSRVATGILLVNLGTPDEPTTPAVRRYLRQFLSDPRVVELPRALWLPILYGAILTTRPQRSAHAYRQIWTPEGSPLLVISRRIAAKLDERLGANSTDEIVTDIAMTYGNPSIRSALTRMRERNVRRLIVLPLYPQYSASTTGSAFDQVASHLQRERWLPEFSFVTHYHDRPAYIAALAGTIRRHWQQSGRGSKLLMSFHGLPRRYLLAGDPYHCQCLKTARLLAEALELSETDYAVAFQSRVGREEWLRPYTEDLLDRWGRQNTGDIDIVCPGFAADCLETLEEIAIRGAAAYRAAGGGNLRYVPCLNDAGAQINLLAAIAGEKLQGLSKPGAQTPDELALRRQRATALGAVR